MCFDQKVKLTSQQLTSVVEAHCSCTIGMGGQCGHIGGVLYKVAKLKARGFKVIPVDQAKTSQAQTWHKPRGPQIRPINIQDMEVVGYQGKPVAASEPQQQKTIKSTLYNPIRTSLPPFNSLHEHLCSVAPDALILPALINSVNIGDTVESNVGSVPKGSVLSYHQKLSSLYVFNIQDGVSFPTLPVCEVMVNSYSGCLTYNQHLAMEDVVVEKSDVHSFEELTREQSGSELWHKLRQNRITASKIGEVFKRQKDFLTLVARLKSTRYVCTPAMRHGIDSEPIAATAYGKIKDNSINLYPSGIIISPKAPWLSASPDRKVYDPSRTYPFCLLEIKCPVVNSVIEASFLKRLPDNSLALKLNHTYYFQILAQLAITGLVWCDLLVWCENDYHLETIFFDMDKWHEVKDKVDQFFFNYFIEPSSQSDTQDEAVGGRSNESTGTE